MFAAAIVCAPAGDLGLRITEMLDELNLASDHSTLTVLMDVSALPSWIYSLHETIDQNKTISSSSNPKNHTNNNNIMNFLDKISEIGKKYLLFFTESHTKETNLIVGYNRTIEESISQKVDRTLQILNGKYEPKFEFFLFDLKDDESLRCLLSVRENNNSEITVYKISNNLEEWVLKHKDEECDNCESELAKMLSVLIILGCSCLLVTLLFGAAALARYQLLKKRVAKGPYKVLLTATDFVFPQISDSRRVSIFLIKTFQILI